MKNTLFALSLLATPFFGTGQAVAETNPVRLLFAIPEASMGNYTYICAAAKNIGLDGQVYLHYNDGTASWRDESMWLSSDQGDHSRYCWYHYSASIEFVLHYTSNVVDAWDNNYGGNYHVPACQVGGNVSLAGASVTCMAGSCSVNVRIVAKNLSYNKQVGIRYTTNDWISWQDANGTYNASFGATGCEYWDVRVNSLSAGAILQFAAYYKNLDWSEEYWDNDFQQNYRISLSDGSSVE